MYDPKTDPEIIERQYAYENDLFDDVNDEVVHASWLTANRAVCTGQPIEPTDMPVNCADCKMTLEMED